MKFKSIRCNNDSPTPYLKEKIKSLELKDGNVVVDLGCGNGRNTKYLRSLGFTVYPFDKKPDFGVAVDLAQDHIPNTPSPKLIICNYLMCFMTPKERKHLANEIDRIASPGCHLMVELYAAKTGKPYTTEEIRNLFPKSKWETRHLVKDRFILKRVE